MFLSLSRKCILDLLSCSQMSDRKYKDILVRFDGYSENVRFKIQDIPREIKVIDIVSTMFF